MFLGSFRWLLTQVSQSNLLYICINCKLLWIPVIVLGLKSSPNKRRKSVVSGPNMDKMTLVSQYRTNKVFATTDPVWDECMYMCCNHNSQIVLTLFDHNTMGRHQFLGQVNYIYIHICQYTTCQSEFVCINFMQSLFLFSRLLSSKLFWYCSISSTLRTAKISMEDPNRRVSRRMLGRI